MKKIPIKKFQTQSAVLIFFVVMFVGLVFADNSLDDKVKQQKVEFLYAKYKKSFPEVADVSAQEAIALMENRSC